MLALVFLFVSACLAQCPSYSVNYISGPLSSFDDCYNGVASDSSSSESDFCGCLASLVDSLGGLDCTNTAGGTTTALSSWITAQGSGLASQINNQVSGNHGADFVAFFSTFTSYSTLGSSYTQLSSSAANGWGNNWVSTCGSAMGFDFESWLDTNSRFGDITTIWDTTNAMWDTTLVTKNGLSSIDGNVLKESVTFASGVTQDQQNTFIGSLTYWCWIESNYGDFTHLIQGAFIKNGGMGCYAYQEGDQIYFRLGVNDEFTPTPSTVSFVASYDLPSAVDCPGPAGTNLNWTSVVNTYFSTLVITDLQISNCTDGSNVLVITGNCPGHHDITNEVYDIMAAYPDTLPSLDLTVTVNDANWLKEMVASSEGTSGGAEGIFAATALLVIALTSLVHLN